jgi:hypothetical protein
VKAANIDISADKPILLASDSIKLEDYGFRLSFQDERIAHLFLSTIGANKANAFTCVSFLKTGIQSN